MLDQVPKMHRKAMDTVCRSNSHIEKLDIRYFFSKKHKETSRHAIKFNVHCKSLARIGATTSSSELIHCHLGTKAEYKVDIHGLTKTLYNYRLLMRSTHDHEDRVRYWLTTPTAEVNQYLTRSSWS